MLLFQDSNPIVRSYVLNSIEGLEMADRKEISTILSQDPDREIQEEARATLKYYEEKYGHF